ncbi:hypothetical protein SmJEL517_g01257 [Synchytrium microbalum]|uniref:Peptide-methionine (R)-S-oxide reductase n=1 Tax=Synchytrium microbalum TaxID=1806994 RepID=A0A507CF85_9FUNG|nr:uncharacterized protein SmJEL517_g01257 [Synchytrium microbalum]TPX36584.1 hypothetical protein SmJEL517_g01257 [Synchytrium microbalum]
MSSAQTVQKSDSEWRAVLSKEQFRVLRMKGTEAPGSSPIEKSKADGIYGCAGCGTPLYKSTTKFDSGCGWPAFFDAIPGTVTRHEDNSGGMQRIEITCTACGGHLGHVFKGEGFPTPTDERHLEEVPVSKRRRFMNISAAVEERISRGEYANLMAQFGDHLLPSWHPYTRMANKVSAKLIEVTGLKDAFKWEVHVVDAPMVNAMVLPGK